MRVLFLLILIAGAALGIGYPLASANFAGGDIGAWRVYDRDKGFRPFEARLTSSDAPVTVLVDLTSQGEIVRSPQSAVLTLTASSGGDTVLAKTLSFAHSPVREASPQHPDRIYSEEAGTIADIEDGAYRFVVGPGDAEGVRMVSVDVVLSRGAAIDRRAQPLGFSLMAIGFIGMVLAFRRGRPDNPNSQPKRPRWGRGGTSRRR